MYHIFFIHSSVDGHADSVAYLEWCATQALPRAKCGPWTSNIGIIWELVRKCRLSIFTPDLLNQESAGQQDPLGISLHSTVWEARLWYMYLATGETTGERCDKDVGCFCLQLPVHWCTPSHPKMDWGTSLAVQWLGLCTLTAEGVGSIPG